MLALKDKTVLIIGRGSGIARSIALAVSEEGAEVIAAGLHPEDLAGSYRGTDIGIEQVDVTDESSVAALAGRITRLNHVVSTASARARGGRSAGPGRPDRLAHPGPAVAAPRGGPAQVRLVHRAVRPRPGPGRRRRGRDGPGQPQLPPDLQDQAMAAQLQALAGWHDELAGPVAEAILAEKSQHDRQAVVAALVVRAVISWDHGQVSDGLKLLRDAARHGAVISPDARQVQPLLALAAALVDLRQLDEAEEILPGADSPPLHDIPAQAALSILRARIHLAAGRLPDAAAAGQAALDTAERLGAHGYAAAAHCVLAVIALRRGDVTAAAHHLARRPEASGRYARTETTLAQAQISEARDGPAAVIGHIRQVCADLPARPGLLLKDPATAAWLTRTALAAGEDELAAIVARSTETLASDHPGYPAITAAAAHSLGLASQDPARLAEAAAQHPDPWAKASAAEDLGVLHARQAAQAQAHDHDQAIYHLTQAIGGYQLTGATADTARVRRRLRQLGVQRRHWTQTPRGPVTGWESLTGTERAVSELVAQGLNNRQVAHRMYVSVNTVAFYLRQIFRKLNIGSRVDLARIVLQQTV